MSVKRIKNLVKQLNEYRHAYYNQDAPLVSDAEYDRLFDELKELEEQTGFILSNSPTQTVGYYPVSELAKVTHPIPLLSLEKTKLISELLDFMKGQEVLFMLKLDGLTTKLIYEDGRLIQASTRGDGEVGEDITHNIPAFLNVPLTIPLHEINLGDRTKMEQYYYNHMDKQKQAAYHAMLQGIRNLTDEFQIPALDADSLYNVFFQLRLDHPEIFWATGYKYRYYKDSPNIIFIPEYLFEKNKIREHQKAMTARIDKLVRTAAKLSEWEKEKYVHDFICENIRYDKLKKPYSHEIIGPLGQGVGVCEGIAKAVKVLLDELGVWCVIAICGNNPDKGIKYRHTWNIVRVGGVYYHLDATFDNTLGKNDQIQDIRYDYFNLDDKSIFRDHEDNVSQDSL